MAAKFEYDESGGTSFYFLLSFLALILVPCTYYFWPFTKEEKEDAEKSNNCLCVPCMKKRSRLKTKEKKNTKYTSTLLLLAGWIVFALLIYKVSTIEREVTIFDPYEVLGLDKSASMGEIRRAYRKLSLQYHPDKQTGDSTMFMKIAKSYQALTDEESRKNWEEFGSPDGPQAAEFGIALPAWIVDKDNSVWVLGAYLLAFIVILPICVGTWWYRSIKYTSDEILIDSTRLYYHFLVRESFLPIKRAITILSGSMEFEPTTNKSVAIRPSDNTELPELIHKLPEVSVDSKFMPFNLPFSTKARLLIGAHLERLQLPPTTLEVDKDKILSLCPRLVREMVSCLSQIIAYYHQQPPKSGHRGPGLDAIENNMRLSSILVQAVKDHQSPLLQLPHFTMDSLRYMRTKKRTIRTLTQLAELQEKERRDMLRHFDGQEYSDVITVLAAIPHVTIECNAEVKDDTDPTYITAGALITVTTVLRRSTLGERYHLMSVEELVAAYESHDRHSDGTSGAAAAAACADVDYDDGEDAEDEDKASKTSLWTKKKDKKPAKKSKQQSKGDRRKKMKELAKQKEEEEEQAAQAARRVDDEENDEDASSGNDDAGDQDDYDDEDDGARADPPSPRSGGGPRRRRKGPTNDSDSDGDGDVKGKGDDDEDEWKTLQQERGEKFKFDGQKKSPEVHAPFYPDTKHEKWWLYVCDRKRKELISPPQLISSLRDEEELKVPVPAPAKPCTLTYSVVLKSDSYVDTEYVYNLKIDVHEAPELPAEQQYDSEDEDEEDEDGLVEMSTDEDGTYSDDED